ncbi:MAG: zinc-ribbon domain-containing protein [Ruminococcus sp.]|nr:zinc-ribbon domain-containing protein [Ruminococcus sp.]
MYCIHCGSNLPDDSKFCSNCGKAVETNTTIDNARLQSEIIAERTAEGNPYADVAPAGQPQQTVTAQPVQNLYPTYQVQNTSAVPQPQYLRPVQTPQGVQYVPVEPVSYYRKPVAPPKHNPFTFVSAGITGTMILLLFLPWITVGDGGYNIISMLTESTFLERFDAGTFAVCSLFMLICLGMLIPAFILTFVRKNQMPVGFSVTASVLTFVNLFFFLIFTDIATSAVSATIIPVLMFFLAAANIVFAVLARKK